MLWLRGREGLYRSTLTLGDGFTIAHRLPQTKTTATRQYSIPKSMITSDSEIDFYLEMLEIWPTFHMCVRSRQANSIPSGRGDRCLMSALVGNVNNFSRHSFHFFSFYFSLSGRGVSLSQPDYDERVIGGVMR
jgi:hypothetical protein